MLKSGVLIIWPTPVYIYKRTNEKYTGDIGALGLKESCERIFKPGLQKYTCTVKQSLERVLRRNRLPLNEIRDEILGTARRPWSSELECALK